MKTLTRMLLCLGVVLLGTVSVASAEVVHSSLWADMDTAANVITGSSQPFYEYPQGTDPSWWNAWFFNSPQIEGWKWIAYYMELRNTSGNQEVEVAINWSGPGWTDPGRPPTDPAEDPFIVRETIFLGALEPGLNILESVDPIIIPDYNPIWVSYDVRAFEGSTGELQMDVWIDHEHVPEPATMTLLAFGSLAVLRRRRKQ